MTATRSFGKCVLHDEFASGGMASVFIGELLEGDVTRTVAVKRLHRHIAATASGAAMFEDEARLSANLRHPNIVATLDVVRGEDELLLVMEYIHGVSLAALERRARERDEPIPISIVAAVVRDVLFGLDAAHRAADEHGEPMRIVHRDVSPQNVIVGADGVARVLDFGIAKAATQLHTTRDGQLKGKLRYMAPEQLTHDDVTVRTDVYGAAVVCWELLTGDKLFVASSEGRTVAKVLEGVVIQPSRLRANVPEALDAIVMRGLARAPGERFASAREMADALLAATSAATPAEVGVWVAATAPAELAESAARIERLARGVALDPPGADVAIEPPRVGVSVSARGDGDSARADHTVTFEREDKRPDVALAPASAPLPSAPAGPSPRPRVKIALTATVVVAAAAFAWLALAERDPAPAISTPTTKVEPEPAGRAAASSIDEPAPPLSASVSGAVAVPSSASPAAPTSAAAALPPRERRPVRGSARPAPASSRSACSPIYATGPDGIRRIKPECL